MSNDKTKTEVNVWERITKLWFSIGKMLMDGVRDPEKVADLLQFVAKSLQAMVDEKVCVYLKRLFVGESFQVITFDGIEVIIYQLIKNATFQEMFRDIGEKRRCWKNKEQALAFACKHKDKLGPNGNFFELEDGLVASVLVNGAGQPYVSYVYELSFDYVWLARYEPRVFSPQ